MLGYEVKKYNWNTGDELNNYGMDNNENDVKQIVKGYKYNEKLSNENSAIFDREGSSKMFIVTKNHDWFKNENLFKLAFWIK